MATQKPDLTRVWASDAPANNVVDPDTTTPGKFSAGWLAEVPPFEHFNYLQKHFSQGLAYLNENGIGEWDSNSTYPTGAIVKLSGKLYIANAENTNENPSLSNEWIGFNEVDDVSKLAGRTGAYDGQQISLTGWHPGSNVGGGTLVWNPNRAKSDHNGGTVFSPTVPWTTATADYLNGVGETDPSGLGVWERLGKDFTTPEEFGAIGDGITEDFPSWNALTLLQKTLLLKSELENPKYLISGQLLFTNSLHLDMPEVTIIKPTGDFDVKGNIQTLNSDLTAEVFAGEFVMNGTDGSEFSTGDLS